MSRDNYTAAITRKPNSLQNTTAAASLGKLDWNKSQYFESCTDAFQQKVAAVQRGLFLSVTQTCCVTHLSAMPQNPVNNYCKSENDNNNNRRNHHNSNPFNVLPFAVFMGIGLGLGSSEG